MFGFGKKKKIVKQKNIQSILIANRGEIAYRIIKTAKKIGIKTIVIYGNEDKNALFIQTADKAVLIEDENPQNVYLDGNRIASIAKKEKVDAVIIGYGFLSENADFVELLEKENITFIGPNSSSIRAVGDKFMAKKLAIKVKVPILPSSHDIVKTPKEAVAISTKIGFPVILKAVAGGGGKGMRIVNNKAEMEEKFNDVLYEAKTLFKNPDILIEKYITSPRHIEVQVVGDKYGNIVCLGERECSIQRNGQKIIEEAPSPFVNGWLRRKMYKSAVNIAKACGYYSVGTIEFVVDDKKHFYFIEMNTRLQVEHPVSEFITGQDFIKLMVDIENGKKLPFKRRDVKLKGHAIECRICAENPSKNFMPSNGTITYYKEPPLDETTRIESCIQTGECVSPYFDSMFAKLICYGTTRLEAWKKMKKKLSEYEIEGIFTNIQFLENVIRQPRFVAGNLSTTFIKDIYPNGFNSQPLDDVLTKQFICSAVVIFTTNRQALFRNKLQNNADNNENHKNAFTDALYVVMDDKSYLVKIDEYIENQNIVISYNQAEISMNYSYYYGNKQLQGTIDSNDFSVKIDAKSLTNYVLTAFGVKINVSVYTPSIYKYSNYMLKKESIIKKQYLVSPMTGVVSKIKVSVGDYVECEQELLAIDAMKMRNTITAEFNAKIKNIFCKIGENIKIGEKLLEFDFE